MKRRRFSGTLFICLATSFCLIFIGCTADADKTDPLSSVHDHLASPKNSETDNVNLETGKQAEPAAPLISHSLQMNDIPEYPAANVTEKDVSGLWVWEPSNRQKTKKIVLPTEMGKEPVPFELLDLAYLPFTTYVSDDAEIQPIKRGPGTGVLFGNFEIGDYVEVMVFRTEDSADFKKMVKSIVNKYFPDLTRFNPDYTREGATYIYDAQDAGGHRFKAGEYNDYFFYVLEKRSMESEISADARDVLFKEWIWRDGQYLGDNRNQKEEIDRKMQQYIEGITQKKPELIVDLMDDQTREYYGMERAQAAIEDYGRIFGHSRLQYRFDSIEGNYPEKYFNYLIFGEDGPEVRARVASSKDSVVFLGDRFLDYAWFARQHLSGFIEALRRQDPFETASALQVDDLWYPVVEAAKAIKNYKDAFDTNSMTSRLVGLDEYENFVYMISGTKKGVPKEHRLTVVCGDGLTGIKDEWVPSGVELWEPEIQYTGEKHYVDDFLNESTPGYQQAKEEGHLFEVGKKAELPDEMGILSVDRIGFTGDEIFLFYNVEGAIPTQVNGRLVWEGEAALNENKDSGQGMMYQGVFYSKLIFKNFKGMAMALEKKVQGNLRFEAELSYDYMPYLDSGKPNAITAPPVEIVIAEP